MNTQKAVLAGVAGGVGVAIWEFIAHGLIFGSTYANMTIFRQDTNMVWYPIVAIVMGIMAGLLFGKSRGSWGAGAKGGLTFGFFLGLVSFAAQFYNSLTFAGFPYYMDWCWGGINLISMLIFGAIAGAIYKE